MRYVQVNGTTFIRHVIDNGEPTEWDENHNTRPSKLTPEEATLFGVHKLQLVTPPFHNPLTQTRTDADAVLVNGVWTQNWVIADMPVDEAAMVLISEKNKIRKLRNDLLTACDWTQLGDNTADKETWATYRQALRDITSQSDFPLNVEWPTSP